MPRMWSLVPILFLMVSSLGLLVWLIKQERERALAAEKTFALLLSRQTDLSSEVAEAIEVLEKHLLESRRREKAEDKAALDRLPLGSFLPTDEASAQQEKELRRAEDRFQPASNPIRYSSGRSPSSPGR